MEREINPAMHTAEHILNQTMIRIFGCGRCFSAHIENKKSKCDYHFDRALEPNEIIELEDQINIIIKKNLNVCDENISLIEAKQKYNLTRLPKENETIRIINIGDYDSCPCIGKHVSSTNEIGIFKIISTDFKDGILRIRYKLLSN